MVRFQKYQDMVSRGSSDRRRIVTNTLKGCRRENALFRLEAAKAALSNLKVQLSNGQSLDPKAEVHRAIARLETAPNATV